MRSQEDRLAFLERELASLRMEYEDIMAAISHDLSAPFRQTGGFAEIILRNNDTVFDEKTKRHFGFITAGAKKGSSIIQALNEFTFLFRNSKDFVEVNCQDLVDEVLETFSPWIEQSKAIIETRGLPVVDGDREQLRLVFSHLVKNALLYHDPDRDVQIELSCEDYDTMWSFTISDNGIGIAENMDERIFRVLKRGVAQDEYPGHGMGLAIAKKIIQRHGGAIGIVKKPSYRTAFNFSLSKQPKKI